MPYDAENFVGLYQESIGGFQYRRYIYDLEPFDSGGTTEPCPHDANPPFHFGPWVADCRVNTKPDVIRAADLSLADYTTLLDDVTVAERGALTPEPAFVQVHVHSLVHTDGAGPHCPDPSDPQACLENTNSGLQYDVTNGFGAEFPWDTGVYTEPIRTLELGITDASDGVLNGMLVREPDGGTYAGDPTNDAVETLIPWAQFIANPAIEVRTSIIGEYGVWYLRSEDPSQNVVTVRLWYSYLSSDGLISFIGGA